MWVSYLINFKLILASLALMAAMYAVINHFETKGYDRAVTELRARTNEAVQKATNEAVSQAAKELQKALDTQQAVFESELKRSKLEGIVNSRTEKVVEYVEKVHIINECTTISDAIIKLLNTSISENNSASSEDTEGGSETPQ